MHICGSPIRRMMPMTGLARTSGSREAVRNLVGGLAETGECFCLVVITVCPVLNKFVAAEITTTVRDIPIEVPLGSIEGMPKPCVVNCDNLRTISQAQLVKKIARLSQKRVHEVKRAVGYALAWEELILAGE